MGAWDCLESHIERMEPDDAYTTRCLQPGQMLVDGFKGFKAILELRPMKPQHPASETLSYTEFEEKFNRLTINDRRKVFNVDMESILKKAATDIPCIGCRRCLDSLLGALRTLSPRAIPPFVVSSAGISIDNNLLNNPHECYKVMSLAKKDARAGPEQRGRKKHQRCQLHGMEAQKHLRLGSWLDVWLQMSAECKHDVAVVDSTVFSDALDAYLLKHRFCPDCKEKLLYTYSMLLGLKEPDFANGYNTHLFEGLVHCDTNCHILIPSDTNFVTHLISRARDDLVCGERHATTIEQAQKELLICLGNILWERLQQIWIRVRSVEQAAMHFCQIVSGEIWKLIELECNASSRLSVSQLMHEFDTFNTNKKSKKKNSKKKKTPKKRTQKEDVVSDGRICQVCSSNKSHKAHHATQPSEVPSRRNTSEKSGSSPKNNIHSAAIISVDNNAIVQTVKPLVRTYAESSDSVQTCVVDMKTGQEQVSQSISGTFSQFLNKRSNSKHNLQDGKTDYDNTVGKENCRTAPCHCEHPEDAKTLLSNKAYKVHLSDLSTDLLQSITHTNKLNEVSAIRISHDPRLYKHTADVECDSIEDEAVSVASNSLVDFEDNGVVCNCGEDADDEDDDLCMPKCVTKSSNHSVPDVPDKNQGMDFTVMGSVCTFSTPNPLTVSGSYRDNNFFIEQEDRGVPLSLTSLLSQGKDSAVEIHDFNRCLDESQRQQYVFASVKAKTGLYFEQSWNPATEPELHKTSNNVVWFESQTEDTSTGTSGEDNESPCLIDRDLLRELGWDDEALITMQENRRLGRISIQNKFEAFVQASQVV